MVDRHFTEIDSEFEARERQNAKELKKTAWWKNKIHKCHCYYCGRELSKITATMDHIIPISRGGRSTKNNVVTCCRKCNQAKKNMTVIEFEEFLAVVRIAEENE